MTRTQFLSISIPAVTAALLVVGACRTPGPAAGSAGSDPAHAARVMTSEFCATCHPAIYAEHEQNTHGRAFTDEEVRLATGRFDHGDCIRCHTPRPIFETGIGMNPIRRWYDLEEGNSCMTCHFKAGQDYGRFEGGAECTTAFDRRVGTVEACASCHRNHGTPYQWEKAPTGKLAGRVCVDCHMAKVRRPVAVGEEPRLVRSHVFPGARNEQHVRRAYSYEAQIDGNEVVVRIENDGAGHHFPTELKQRSLESLVIVRDDAGEEIARSRMVFRDPYKRPYGLRLPINTQIPPGESREHRVPIQVASGTVDCELHFKHYYPIEDYHPDLAWLLESRQLLFDGLTPSDRPVESAPEVAVVTPESIRPEEASLANLVDYARPPIGTVEVDVPEGDSPDDIRQLVSLFQFPVPEANRHAQARLVEIGAPAIPDLIDALGSWDNKTFKQASSVLGRIGRPAVEAVYAAAVLEAPERNSHDFNDLYVRYNARDLLTKLPGIDRDRAFDLLSSGLESTIALDRRSAAVAIGKLRLERAAPRLRELLVDADPDVVAAAAGALARVGDYSAVPRIQAALDDAFFPETQRDLAVALARLGSAAGIPVLLAGLDIEDDLVRESYFESLFAVTGVHLGYDPLAPRPVRLAGISALEAWWAKEGGPAALRRPPGPDEATRARAWELVTKLGSEEYAAAMDELLALGSDAVPALVLGLKYPPGFAQQRARICDLLGRIGDRDAAPALAATLRDPVVAVAAWACWALEGVNDPEVLPALRRYTARLHSLEAQGGIPAEAGSYDQLIAQVGRTRLLLGDEHARDSLVRVLLSADAGARRTAIGALEAKYGDALGYDPDGDVEERRAGAARWMDAR